MEKILCRDNVNLVPFQVDKQKRHFFETKDSDSTTGHSLAVVFAATHSGILTGNGAFYLPDEQRKGLSSWITPYKKPIGRHHAGSGGMFSGPNQFTDPIGRIQFANYVDLTQNLKRKSQQFGDRLNDSKATIDDHRKTAQYIVTKVQGKDKTYRGTGYVEIGGIVFDPEAIQKVLDGRYVSVSISKIVDDVVCSVCGQHWKQDGLCEHEMGEIDEETGYLGFKIPIGYHGTGLDYVNTPADPFGMQILIGENFESLEAVDSINWSKTKGFVTEQVTTETALFATSFEKKEIIDLRGSNFSNILDSGRVMINNLNTLLEETHMKNGKKVESVTPVIDDATVDAQQAIQEEVVTPPVEETVIVEDSATEEQNVDPVSEPEEETGEVTDQQVQDSEVEVVPDDLLDFSTLLDFIQKEGPEKFYDSFITKELDELELSDAKLSTETRKSLSASKFCGPNRSFPVNDCAHVRAATRLLNRYKGDGSRDKIKACIERANKRMSCGVGETKNDSLDTTQLQQLIDTFLNTELTDEQAQSLVDAIYPVIDKFESLTPISKLRQEIEVTDGNYAALLEENDELTKQFDELQLSVEDADKNIITKESVVVNPADTMVDAIVTDVEDPTLTEQTTKTVITLTDEQLKEQQLIKDYWRICSLNGTRRAEAFWTSKTNKPLP